MTAAAQMRQEAEAKEQDFNKTRIFLNGALESRKLEAESQVAQIEILTEELQQWEQSDLARYIQVSVRV